VTGGRGVNRREVVGAILLRRDVATMISCLRCEGNAFVDTVRGITSHFEEPRASHPPRQQSSASHQRLPSIYISAFTHNTNALVDPSGLS
jgi:hypothetical protein